MYKLHRLCANLISGSNAMVGHESGGEDMRLIVTSLITLLPPPRQAVGVVSSSLLQTPHTHIHRVE